MRRIYESAARIAIGVTGAIFLCQPFTAIAQAPGPYVNPSVNYIRTWDAMAPEQDGNTLMGRPLKDVKMATQYIDGLGRPIQTVMKQGSLETGGTAVDMVNASFYDEYGREQYKYLPFAANNTNGNTSISDGLFKNNPFEQQATFMSQQYGAQGENTFYSKTDFEASPLNRTLKQMAAGNSWAGSSRGVEMKYWLNTQADSVLQWKCDNVAGNFGNYSVTGLYGEGKIYKNATVDEHGKQVVEFKDRDGKVLLKKVQLISLADDGSGRGYSGWLNTYYIYDDMGNLRAVIQPEGVKALVGNGWQLTTTIQNEQCFRYEYDGRNRMIKKKVPGAGEVWMVYDAKDRLVLTQDANLRLQQKWMYTSYDILNRPVASGLITDPTNYNNLDYHLGAAYYSSSYPTVANYTNEELTRTFYDSYAWLANYGNPLPSVYNSSYDTYFQASSAVSWPYAQANTPTVQLRGVATGTRIKILGTNTYLYTVSFYDQKGKPIQVQSTNITGGTDITTTQYTWAGQPLVIVQKQDKQGTNAQTSVMVTQLTYDDLGRLAKTEKKVSNTLVNSGTMPGYKTIAENEYDKLGQLKKKKLAPAFNNNAGLETLNYEYNIRGWMLGMNRDYARDANSTNYFGFDLGYDKANNNLVGGQTYANPQYNGNIEGMVWKSKGDGEKRKYDFAYDAANRLLKADFTQYTGGSFNQTAGVNFNVKMGDGTNVNTAYDDNGNILQMQQWGLKLAGSSQIDNLAYVYQAGSNKLAKVTDANSDPNTKLGDFKDGTNTGDDYSYDVNGNMNLDNNKAISSITYNHLNLPQTITVTGKGTISYTYDAAGNKLRKTTVDNTVSPAKTTITDYMAGSVFQNDTLQFLGQEEGRIRFKAATNTAEPSLQYDYMLKDHLGNVRMVLTEEQQVNSYPPASMEDVVDKNNLNDPTNYIPYYANADYTTNSSLRYPKSNISGYPVDNYTTPNNYVSKLRGDGQKIGPSMTLKVMAGDKFNLRATSWYKLNGATPQTPNPLTELANALATGIAGVSGGKATVGELTSSGLSPNAASSFLNTQTYNSARPKAFINWVFLDEQFKYYAGGFEQVGADQEFKTHVFTDIPANKNGYLYVYLSNETPNVDVFFDNLQVTHTRGPILEETHYYPFGLTMNGISSKALTSGGFENKKKYQSYEFNCDFDLNLYESFYRTHDPQLGRFWQIDPKPYYLESLYVAMGDNPVKNYDILGDELGGADIESAKRQKDIINNSVKSKGGAAFRDLIALKNDGMTFKSISQKSLNKALAQITNADERSLARGYAKAINSKNQMFVRIVNRNENPDIENKKMNKAWRENPGSAANIIGNKIDDEHGGGITQFTNGQSLSVIVMNSTFQTTYENKETGEVVNSVASAEENSAHEILGHGLGKFSESKTYQNQDAIKMSNLYRRSIGDNVLYRTGEIHPPGNIRMSPDEANQTPDYLNP